MRNLLRDVAAAGAEARQEASRELWITLCVTLCTFLVGPLVFALLILPSAATAEKLFEAFSSADVYIASVSLLSISIYSISKEYNSDGRGRFGFPHAATIMCVSLLILLIASSVYTSRVIYQAIPNMLQWRGLFAGILGWLVFLVASAFAYAVLVLRNDVERGGQGRARAEENDFASAFALGGGARD